MHPEPAIHKFSFGDMKLVVDANSGALHQVDDVTWAVLDYFPQENSRRMASILQDRFPAAEIDDAFEALENLCKEGLLFSQAPPLPRELWPADPQVKALCLHVAHDCNLGCRYCFGQGGGFGGDRELMSPRVGRRAVDFLLTRTGDRSLCEIDFFGGEPLLNLGLVKEVVGYARARGEEEGKEFRFTLTTNGVLLDQETRAFLNDNNINVVLSVDGRPEIHDRMRPFPGGKGSYHHVIPLFRALNHSRGKEVEASCVVRGTFTRNNLDFAADVLHLVDEGFSYLSLEPVVAKGGEYALAEKDLPRIAAQYEKLALAYLDRYREGRPFRFFHFDVYLNQGPCLAKRIAGCGAGHEYFAVTPGGDLYPCHQFVGRPEFRLGDLWRGLEKTELSATFRGANVYNKGDCCACWARFFCSGGCHANNHLFSGDIRQPYPLGCELSKIRIQYALAVQAALEGMG